MKNKPNNNPLRFLGVTSQSRASGTGRVPILTGLQCNPLIAVAATIVGPIVNLFRQRRAIAAQVERLKLESYRSRPWQPSASQCPAEIQPGSSQDAASSKPATSQRAYSVRPGSIQNPASSNTARSRKQRSRRPQSNASSTANLGGLNHG